MKIRRFGALCSLLLLCLLHAGCRPSPQSATLHVVASIAPLAYFAERVGGRYVTVSLMVPPGGNPHSYEPTPKQMSALAEAALFVKAGSGVEFELDWMPRFLSLNSRLKVCDASEGVTLMALHREEEGDEHQEGENHRHEGIDPHYWMSPENAIFITRNIEKALSAADPSHKAYYRANAGKLVAELLELHREIAGRLGSLENRRFLVFHPAWGYYATAFGLEQTAAEDEGKSLTPRKLQAVIGKARKNGIRVVFVSPQFSTVQAEAIARDIGGVTGTVDPLARDYQENLRRATAAFIRGMQ